MTEPTFRRLKIALDQIKYNIENDVFKSDQILIISTSMLETINLIDNKFTGFLDSLVANHNQEEK